MVRADTLEDTGGAACVAAEPEQLYQVLHCSLWVTSRDSSSPGNIFGLKVPLLLRDAVAVSPPSWVILLRHLRKWDAVGGVSSTLFSSVS